MAAYHGIHIALVLLISTQALHAEVNEKNEDKLSDPEDREEVFETPDMPEHIDINTVAEPSGLDWDLLGENFLKPELNKATAGAVDPLAYPPPPEKEPVVTEWRRPMHKTHDIGNSAAKGKAKPASRRVKSFTVDGDKMTFNPGGEVAKSRVKRSHLGTGVSDAFEFTLEALDPFTDEPAGFMIGSVIPYRATLHANDRQTNVQMEIFSELNGGGYFIISNVRYGSIGSNFGSYSSTNKPITYRSTYSDGRYDYATIDLGTILNDLSNTDTESESQIEILFEAQAVNHPDLVQNDEYRISVGALFDSTTITVAQDDLVYSAGEPSIDVRHLDTYSLTGPDSLTLGTTGVWSVSATLHDLYTDVSLDVLAPVNQPGTLRIESISVGNVGENYRYCGLNDNSYNTTRLYFENYGDYLRVDFGTIFNKGYFDGDYTDGSNTITLDVAVTMLDHSYNSSHPYTLGFTIWSAGTDSVDVMWSAQTGVQADGDDLPELTTSPTFTVEPSADVVAQNGHFAVLVNMSLPRWSSTEYMLEVSTPLHSNAPVLAINHMRVSKIGFNLPVLHEGEYAFTNVSTDGASADFMTMDLGIITNTGQRSDEDSQIVQVEVAMTLLDEAFDHYSATDDIEIAVGVKHATDYYWVGQTTVNAVSDPISYTADQMPFFTHTNIMGSDAYIYSETAAVLDLDIVIPPGVDLMPIDVIMTSKNGTHDVNTTLKFTDVEILHIGQSLMYQVDALELQGNPDEAPEEDGSAVYDSAHINFTHVTSLRDYDYRRYSFEESTIRIRTTLIARGSEYAAMVEGHTYWVETTAVLADNYIYAGRIGIKYNESITEFYVDNHWQPTQAMELSDGFAEEVGLGTPIFYDVTYKLPYRTAAGPFQIHTEITSGPIQVCEVEYVGHGDAIVDYVAPNATGYGRIHATDSNRLIKAWYHIPTFTSWSYDNYGQTDQIDSFINFTTMVLLDNSATVGQQYSFTTVADLGYFDAVTYTKTITVTDATPTMTTEPSFNLWHAGGTDVINIGGHELYYFDIYVPPGTSYKYEVDLLAPWNDTYYGEYEVTAAYVISSGKNLPCFNGRLITATLGVSDDNPTDVNNIAEFDLGFIPNSRPSTDDFMLSQDNRIRFLMMVSIPQNTTLEEGDEVPVAATVIMNDGGATWIGYEDFLVVSQDDEYNVMTTYNLNGTNFTNSVNETHLGIKADGDMSYTVGETQTYTAKLILPPGIALSQTRLVFESPLIDGEALIYVSDLALTGAGFHLTHQIDDKYYEIVTETNLVNQQFYQQAYLGFVRNPDFCDLSHFMNVTDYDKPDQIDLSFSVRMLDHVLLADGYQFTMNTSFVYGYDNNTIEGKGNTTITAIAPAADTVVFDWSVDIIDIPDTVYQDSNISFDINLDLSTSTKRFPDDLTVMFRIPHYSTMVTNSTHYRGIESAFTPPSSVTQYGLEFKWDRLRWDNAAFVNFTIIVDPDYFLESGLLAKQMVIPVDMRYHMEDKTNPGTFTEMFTTLTILRFELELPECTDYLGMESGMIDDCQLSSSIDDGVNTVQQARLNSSSAGWASLDRGAPYYNSEYVQVNFGGLVKFTGITLQPFMDSDMSRVTVFKVQHSREGILWETVQESGNDKEFQVTWPNVITNDTTVFVAFTGLEFVSYKIRIIPQANALGTFDFKMRFELNGCPSPYKANLTSYTCPSSPPVLRTYHERQWVAYNVSAYVCEITQPNTLPYCSGSNDFGLSWFAIDDNVMNMLGYETSELGLYALDRSRQNTVRSTDGGHTWYAVEDSDFDTMSNLVTYIPAKELPFPLVGAGVADWFSTYGFTDDSEYSWSVSRDAIHAYPVDSQSVSSKADTDDVVGRWGTESWV